MLRQTAGLCRAAMVAAAVASPFASQLALATGWGFAAALPLAAVQAAAAGLILWGMAPQHLRVLAVLAPIVLLTALGWGAWHSAPSGLLAAAGLSHAMLYAGLLSLFGGSLAPGRTPLVTIFARRLNPLYHAGMDGYTRGVTVAWCLFFAGQMVGSVLLLLLAPEVWRPFVTVLGVPLALVMAIAEYCVRRRRFPGMPHIGLRAMIRDMRSFRGVSGNVRNGGTATG